MNLQPLFEVKDRLEHCAVAGTGLLEEDFRLRRAADGLAPLASASPVFAKISTGLSGLLAASPEERGGLLLDVLALVDAVAYTQGVTQAEGEWEPIVPHGDAVYIPLPYSRLKPILTALTTTGSGRLEVLQRAREEDPQLLRDSRIMAALVGDLGDTYGEMADLAAACLRGCGKAAVPLLKEGFDPKGRRDMVRRVELVSQLAGSSENPWYLSMLESAEKETREALIATLGRDPSNASLLRDLSVSEKGGCKKACLWALADMEDEESAVFWQKRLEKQPGDILYLTPARGGLASQLVAAGLTQRLSGLLERPELPVPAAVLQELDLWLAAAEGKSSAGMIGFWQWAAARRQALEGLRDGKGQPLRFEPSHNALNGRESLPQRLDHLLLDSIRLLGAGPLCPLAEELYRQYGVRYLPHAMTAALLTQPAAQVFERFSPAVCRRRLLGLGGDMEGHSGVLRAFSHVRYAPEQGAYALWMRRRDPRTERAVESQLPLFQPLDKRWLPLLIAADGKRAGKYEVYSRCLPDDDGSLDNILANLIDPVDADGCRVLCDYFRQRAGALGKQWRAYATVIDRCGGSIRGVVVRGVLKSGELYWFHATSLLGSAAHTSDNEKADELEELDKAAHDRRFKPLGGKWPSEEIRRMAASLRAGNGMGR